MFLQQYLLKQIGKLHLSNHRLSVKISQMEWFISEVDYENSIMYRSDC